MLKYLILVITLFSKIAWCGQIWIHPNLHTDLRPQSEIDTFFTKSDTDLNSLLSSAEVFQFFGLTIEKTSPAVLETFVKKLNARGIKIAVEAFGLLPYACADGKDAGVVSAQSLQRTLQKIYGAGGRVHYLAFDAFLSMVLKGSWRPDNNCQYDLGKASQEFAEFLVHLKQVDPEIQFGLISNYPNDNFAETTCWWGGTKCLEVNGYRSFNLKDVLNAVMAATKAKGVQVSFLHADNPYMYTKNHAGIQNVFEKRLKPLEQWTTANGLTYGNIFNEQTEDQIQFYNGTAKYLKEYRANGNRATHLVFESWYPIPKEISLETIPYSFAWDLKNFLPAMKAILPQNR